MIEVFKKYKAAGFACLPTKKDKSPLIPQNWRNGFTEEYFKNAEGIGLICGQKSGGLECLDFDNHFGDAKKNLKEYLKISEVEEIYKKYNLPIESTQSGGFHLLFRSAKNGGNSKLAQRLNKEGRPDAIIETRGEGGYFVCAPTPGYKNIRHDIFNIQKITEIERAILIDNASAMNEYCQVQNKYDYYEIGERPGDIYNANSSSIEETKALLQGAGWKELSNKRWRRPGKKEGISATLGKVAPNVFYVFSSNAHPFESSRAYSPFQILTLLKFNGDFSAAAESLPKPERQNIKRGVEPSMKEIEKLLKTARINTDKKVDKPPVILSIVETDGATSTIHRRAFTLGNFSCIIGKAKSKKTFFVTMITAAIGTNGSYQNKFAGSLPSGKRTVLYFDTEQGEYDSHQTISRIKQMGGDDLQIEAFNLRPFSPKERCLLIEGAFRLYGEKIGFCVIDGIADLATGINDEDEATRVTTMLLRLTKEYNCHISTIIHQNKNDNFATGHLGSSIMKKAEILISITKDYQDFSKSEVNCDMSRAIDFEKFTFSINENGIPVIDHKIVNPVDYLEPERKECPF